eukprot:jgi/Pico_ML_1/51897/g361.t1
MTEKVKQKKDHLQNIKKQFEMEEKEWEELLLQHQQTIKDAEGTPEAMKKMRAAAAEATKQERIVSLFLVSARAFVVLAPGDWLRPPLRAQTNSSQWRRSADCDRGLLL